MHVLVYYNIKVPSEAPRSAARQGSGVAATVVWVRSLAWERPCATGVAKK